MTIDTDSKIYFERVSTLKKHIMLQIDEHKFAKTIKKCSENSTFLEEETSRTDNLIRRDSAEAILRRQAEFKAIHEEIEKETEDLEDTSNPELMNLVSPVTPETPTHVSNSLSFSDDGNKDEFLIDDEICDQPQLIFNERGKKSKNMYYPDIVKLNVAPSHFEDSTFPTANFAPQIQSPDIIVTKRSESCISLSLHDSISSEDLMGDFQGSLDSIDR